MKSIELVEVPAIATHVRSGRQEPLFLTQNGHVVGAVVPAIDDDVESMLLSINPRFQEFLQRSQQRLESEGALSSAEVRRRLGLPATDSGD